MHGSVKTRAEQQQSVSKDGLYSSGLHKNSAYPLESVGYSKAGPAQGRSYLRKRDYESELLERLLSHRGKGLLTLIMP